MTLRLYDTASRRVADLVPGTPDRVGIYLCGLTLQAGPHIGHLRSGVNYDVLRRWLVRSGYQVTLVRNLTDIDDKLLASSAATGVPFWAIAYANELTLAAAYRALRVLPPSYEPRATGHIPDMHELISTLVARGHAYPAVDGCEGDVYFDVGSYPDYGALSGQRPADVQPSEDEDPRGKRDPRDFALWKGAKPGEPADAHWPSPWGRGRPGWHIECSAMARRYLGDEFDIHGGGLDLIFPHHENELAQSRATGLGFARYWVHHGLLNLSETKMSKSLGNVLDLAAVTAMGIRPEELRYYLVAPHYRSRIDYSDGALREAAVAYRRLEGFVQRAAERVGSGELGPVCAEFAAAMDDDLNTPQALASLHDVLHEGNTAYTDGNDPVLRGALGSIRAMLDVLGLDPLDPARPAAAAGDSAERALREVADALVALALEQREAARDRKDYATADAVRDRLKQAGIVVEDTARGPRWTIDGG